jgi:DNA-binding LacI/PurR family transcriptional regulator/serine phosphatase RsbU (regulator of sigma subunit)
MTERRKTIAILIDHLGSDYHLGVWRGAEDRARERDVNLLVVVGRALECPTPADAAQNEIYRRIGPMCADGAILVSGSLGIYTGVAGLDDLCQSLRPRPLCSVSVHVPGVPSLIVSNRRGMATVVDHMISAHGRRRVAYIRGPLGSVEAQDRFDGYTDALAAHGIPLDPRLVRTGDFWIPSGAAAISELCDQGMAFDAVVAANDYMAVGALDAIRMRDVKVPGDVLVAGFDDAAIARLASPSLTTVRQPLERLGSMAVDSVCRQLEGGVAPETAELEVELVRRQSCGCTSRAACQAGRSTGASIVAGDALDGPDDKLRVALRRSAPLVPADVGPWEERLLAALRDESSGKGGRFLCELDLLLQRLTPRLEAIQSLASAIDVLRSHVLSAPMDRAQSLSEVFYNAVLLVGEAALGSQARRSRDFQIAHEELILKAERLSTALSHAGLTDTLRDLLPSLGIDSAALSLYVDDTRDELRPIFVSPPCDAGANSFSSERLAPDGFFGGARRTSHVVLPLLFDTEHFGIGVFESGSHAATYRLLRSQVAAALKGISLYHTAVRENALRERAEREHIQKESQIAQKIQKALLPVTTSAQGLQLAALMVPTVEVGGDYYDVLPTEAGCWIGIGDVTGHGLLAGLVMMMIQSMVAALVSRDERASPASLVVSLNAALYENVRNRLRRDEQGTLALIRYERDGTLTFAGHHEELLIYRAATRAWERITTKGFWLGALPDIRHVTTDTQARLEQGDLLVLYTDGVVEAMDAHHRPYGIDRLCALIDVHAAEQPQRICAAVVEAVQAWSPSPADDVSIVVGRYSPG